MERPRSVSTSMLELASPQSMSPASSASSQMVWRGQLLRHTSSACPYVRGALATHSRSCRVSAAFCRASIRSLSGTEHLAGLRRRLRVVVIQGVARIDLLSRALHGLPCGAPGVKYQEAARELREFGHQPLAHEQVEERQP